MKNVLILHGTGNNSQDNWFPWLKKELEEKGYKVWVPDLPNSDKPNYERYNKFIFSKWSFDNESLLIGHSSGAVEILRILGALPENIVVKKTILVAGFKDNLNYEPVFEMFEEPFNWEKIKNRCKEFIFIHSDNDPYVSLEHGEFLKEKLGGKLVILKGQKHFSVSTLGEKYRKFPELLKYLE